MLWCNAFFITQSYLYVECIQHIHNMFSVYVNALLVLFYTIKVLQYFISYLLPYQVAERAVTTSDEQ